MVYIKVCGITTIQDAIDICRLGVNALGFIFAKSPRRITPENARSIIMNVPPYVQTVGVFVNESIEIIAETVKYCGLDIVQLHGEETVSICEALSPRVIKASRVKTFDDVQALKVFNGHVRGFLLDSFSEKGYGGTGTTFDWSIATKAAGILSSPIVLAGGLNPDNISDAIMQVKPYGVDVSSGVEFEPGKKNIDKVKLFVQRVRETERRLVL